MLNKNEHSQDAMTSSLRMALWSGRLIENAGRNKIQNVCPGCMC